MEIRATKKLIKSLNKTMSKLKSKGKIFADMFETKSIVKTYTGALYQTHTLLDLLDMKLAQTKLKRNEDIFLEMSTILATYAGHTIFSLNIEEPEIYKQVEK